MSLPDDSVPSLDDAGGLCRIAEVVLDCGDVLLLWHFFWSAGCRMTAWPRSNNSLRMTIVEIDEQGCELSLSLFLIQALANLFCQCVDGEGLLQERHFGPQDTVANHHIVRIAALKKNF